MKNKKNLLDECVEVSDCVKDSDQIYVHNTIFVDDKFGNNKTAMVERPDKPTQTIASAFKLLERVRKSENKIWNIIVRLGQYKLNVPVPNNVTLLGSGQGTNIFGNLKVIGNASLVEFKLFSDTIPSIHVNVEEGIDNAVVFFTGLDIQTTIKPNLPKCDLQSPRVAIRINSQALNSNIVIRNCRINLNFEKLEEGENKFILTSNSKVDVITSIIQAFGHNSAINTVFENENATVDIEAGNTVFTLSSNQLANPVVFYASSSPNLFFLKDNRIRFLPTITVQNPIDIPPTSEIPNAVIYLLGKENALMQSRNGITNFQGIDQLKQIIAFAASINAQINIQGLETQFGNQGNISGISTIDDISNNITYTFTFDGILNMSGANYTNIITLEREMESYVPKITDDVVAVLRAPTNGIHFESNLASPSIQIGRTVNVENQTNQSIIVHNVPNFGDQFTLNPLQVAIVQWVRNDNTNTFFWIPTVFDIMKPVPFRPLRKTITTQVKKVPNIKKILIKKMNK